MNSIDRRLSRSRRQTSSGGVGLLLAVALLLPVWPSWAGPLAGEHAPQWTMRDTLGRDLRFPTDIEAETSVVLFWASWCPYCSALMPRLAVLQQELGPERLPILALRLEAEAAASGASTVPAGFRTFDDAWDVAEDYGVSVLPALFLVRDGRILYRLDYPPPDHPSQKMPHGRQQAAALAPWWEARIRAHLGGEGANDQSG
jgi:thiol-disulfide isomerase/thioredoxin